MTHTADVPCRLLETMEGMTPSAFGGSVYTKVFPTHGKQRVSESYLRQLFGDQYIEDALRAKVLIRD